MSNPECPRVPGYRAVPTTAVVKEILELKRKVGELENKVDKLQELVDQYEWAMGIGE